MVSHCNQSDTLQSIDTIWPSTRALLANTLFSSLSTIHTHTLSSAFIFITLVGGVNLFLYRSSHIK